MIEVICENCRPYGIRDSGGYLFFFTNIYKYPGQEDRYRKEISEQFKLADDLLIFLRKRATITEDGKTEQPTTNKGQNSDA
jgi:hypothetical protein